MNSQQKPCHPSCNGYTVVLAAIVFLISLMASSLYFSCFSIAHISWKWSASLPTVPKGSVIHVEFSKLQCTWKRLPVQRYFTQSNCCTQLSRSITFCRPQQCAPVECSINFFTSYFLKKPGSNLNPPYLATRLSCCFPGGFTQRFCGTMFSRSAQNWLGGRQCQEVFPWGS